MVKKIQGDFDTDKFEAILSKLGKNFDLLFSEGSLYVALRDYANRDIEDTEIKKYLKPARNFVVKEIVPETLQRESQMVQDWCGAKAVALERQRYEEEQQEKMQRAMKALDLMESRLEEASKLAKTTKKEGGETNSGGKKKKGKTQKGAERGTNQK